MDHAIEASPARARYRQAVQDSRARVLAGQVPDSALKEVVAEQHDNGRWTGECPWCDSKRHAFPGLGRQPLRCESTLSPPEVLVVDEWQALWEEQA